jgi:hypothetical protein
MSYISLSQIIHSPHKQSISLPFPHPRKSLIPPMFARLNLLARHLAKPLPNYAHRSAFTSSGIGTMAEKKMIHTAACLIIGDEVLGGSKNFHSSFHDG